MPNKLTDADIKKALECCINWKREGDCAKCPAYESKELCIKQIRILALDLINRLQAENERLKDRVNKQGLIAQIVIDDDKLENIKNDCLERIEYNIKEIKSEAYKEFAERLKETFPQDDFLRSTKRISEDIDNLLNELVGDGDGKRKD